MKSRWLVLGAAICLLLGLRLYQFGGIPHGVNRDEAAIGYTAKLIAATGKDEHGRIFPSRFESFGDWKQPLYIYLTVLPVLFFGMSPSTVRLISLAAGLIMAMTASVIAQKVSPDKKLGFLTGTATILMLAVNPWHFHFSRIGVEAMLAASLFCCGVFGVTHKNRRYQIGGFAAFSLSLFTYHSALIVIPLWLTGYTYLYRNQWKKRWWVVLLAGVFITALLLLARAWFSAERAKATGTTIFSMTNEEKWEQIYIKRDGSKRSSIIHNQITYYSLELGTHFVSTFSPQFLLHRGGSHPHYNVPGFGNYFLIEIVLAIVGIFVIGRQKNKLGGLILFAILLSPLPAALTKDGMHSTRSALMLPWIQILAAVGLGYFYKAFNFTWWRPFVIAIFLVLLLLQATPFFGYYFGQYKKVSDVNFSGYMQPLTSKLITKQQLYKAIYSSFPYESPYIFYAFYSNMDPQEFFKSIEYYPVDSGGFRHARHIGNLNFLHTHAETASILQTLKDPVLVVERVNEVNLGVQGEIIYNMEGKPEFILYEAYPTL